MSNIITIQVNDKNRRRFLLQLLAELDFVEVLPNASQLSSDERRFVQKLRNAAIEVKAHRTGKVRLKTARELIAEI